MSLGEGKNKKPLAKKRIKGYNFRKDNKTMTEEFSVNLFSESRWLMRTDKVCGISALRVSRDEREFCTLYCAF